MRTGYWLLAVSPCIWASTNQSHLSMAREISVRISAVSSSRSSSTCWIARRVPAPKVARADESASTCSFPLVALDGYSDSVLRAATLRAVPCAVPPS